MSAIKEIVRFNTDRGLDSKEFNKDDFVTNMMEELLELYGVGDNKQRLLSRELKYELLRTVEWVKGLVESQKHEMELTFIEPTEHEEVDALDDLIVFSLGELLKKGYNPESTLLETAREINSRVGSFVDGKFEKDKSEEAKAKWYIADYTEYKLKG